MKNRALLVCHSGHRIGLGHLARVTAVGRALVDLCSFEVEILVFGKIFELNGIDNIRCKELPEYSDFVFSVSEEVYKSSPDVVIFDVYRSNEINNLGLLLAALKRQKVKLVAIDGVLEHRDILDLIWIPSCTIEGGEIAGDYANVRFGWDTFLIEKNKRLEKWRPGSNVLVLTGGSDPMRLANSLPHKLDRAITINSEITWIRGPYADPPAIPKASKHTWHVAESPSTIAPFIRRANYAITVFGVSVFELLQYGVPCVVFSPYGDKDDDSLRELMLEKVAVVASGADDAAHRLSRLILDVKAARNLSITGQAKLSKNGLDGITAEIRELMED